MALVRRWWPLLGLMLIVTAVVTLLTGHSPTLDAVLVLALVNTAMVIALGVFVGNSGVVSFGQISFMAVGAYVCSMFTIPAVAKSVVIPSAPEIFKTTQLTSPLAIVAGGLVAGALAAVVSIPLLRLTGIAASIGTLSLLVITNTFFTNWKPGSSGGGNLTRIPTDTSIQVALQWVLIFLVIAYVYQRSRFGLRLRASRDDDVAARAVGIRIHRERRLAFIISSSMFGVTGGLYAHTIGSISAANFWFGATFITLAMLVLGGSRSLLGAVTGAAILSAVQYVFQQWQNDSPALAITLSVPAGTSDLVIALVLILVLLLRPDGLTGGHELPWPRRHRRRRQHVPVTADDSVTGAITRGGTSADASEAAADGLGPAKTA